MSQLENDPWAEERREIVAKYKRGRAEDAIIEPWEDPTFELYQHVDYHGFIHNAALSQKIKESDEKVRKYDLKREAKWKKLGASDYLNKSLQTKRVNEKLVRGVYKGIPKTYRMIVWKKLLKIDQIKNQKPGVYQRMLELALNHSPDIRQIDLDVNRTFRNTFYFRDRYGNRQQALFHVLAAYSMYNTEIGYCQGMSQLAGLMLIYLIDEEDAFWAISQMMTMEPIQMHGFFICEFPKLIRFFEHHDKVLMKLEPKIAQHFEQQDVISSTYTLKWFMQCFLDRVPMSLCLRLWDIYLLEGEKLLIGMAYNIIKMHKKRLLKMDQNQILIFFQSDIAEDFLFEDNAIISSLKESMDELKKAHLLDPGRPPSEELPRLPFGFRLPTTPVQIIASRHEQQADVVATVRRSMRKKNKHSIDKNDQIVVPSSVIDPAIKSVSNSNFINSNMEPSASASSGTQFNPSHLATIADSPVHIAHSPLSTSQIDLTLIESPKLETVHSTAPYHQPHPAPGIQQNGGDYFPQSQREEKKRYSDEGRSLVNNNHRVPTKITDKHKLRKSTGFLEENAPTNYSNSRITSMPNGFIDHSSAQTSYSSGADINDHHRVSSKNNHFNNSPIEEFMMKV